MKERNIGISILLSLVTCGIYPIVWLYNILSDISQIAPEEDINPGTGVILSIITCGIYTIYLYYKLSVILFEKGRERGILVNDNRVLYIVLALFGFGLVNYAIIQSDINKFSRTY